MDNINIDKEKICILYTGKSEFINEIKKIKNYNNYNFIFSTWKGNESKYEKNDVVVFNDTSNLAIKTSLELQRITILEGLKKSKELGFRRTLKLRDDLIPTNLDKFLELINNENINILCWHEHNIGLPGYFVDYLISGETDLLIDVYSNIDINFHQVSEAPYTKSLLRYSDKIKFFLYDLNQNNNDLFWFRIGDFLSSYNPNLIHTSKYMHLENYENIKKEYL